MLLKAAVTTTYIVLKPIPGIQENKREKKTYWKINDKGRVIPLHASRGGRDHTVKIASHDGAAVGVLITEHGVRLRLAMGWRWRWR